VPIFAVTTMRGPSWDDGRDIRSQPLWEEHASFADGLVDVGVIRFGGPVEDPDERVLALIAVEAQDAGAVHALFAADPWVTSGILELKAVRPWRIWLDGVGLRHRTAR
jgi:uncharacterized protein YciI